MRLLSVSLPACLRAIAPWLLLATTSAALAAPPPPSRPVPKSESESSASSSTKITPGSTAVAKQAAQSSSTAPATKSPAGSSPSKSTGGSSSGIQRASHSTINEAQPQNALTVPPPPANSSTNVAPNATPTGEPTSAATDFANADPTESYWWEAPHKRAFRLRAEHLQWWTTGMNVPPLITSSPIGTPVNQAGVLGLPDTTLVYGGDEVFDSTRAGGRYVATMWLDQSDRLGAELEYFGIFSDTENFSTGTTTGILARPFINALTSQQDAKLIAYPNLLTGNAAIDFNSQLNSAAVRLRYDLQELSPLMERSLSNQTVGRWSASAGYRYMDLQEDLSISENLIDPNLPATIRALDRFDTQNQLHAAELGLLGEIENQKWSLDLDLKVALGVTQQSVNIQGSTNTSSMGIPAAYVGSLYAQSTNVGNHEQTKFSVVPQVGVTVGYKIFDQLKLFAGYRMFYWPDVVRPGDQIDLVVNPSLIPPAIPPVGTPQRPRFEFQEESFFAHALSLGLEFTW